MRRDITIYISCLLIIMIVTSFVSCGSQYTNDSANVLEQKIEIQEYGYAGIEIPINVIFEKEISSVDFGFKNNQITSLVEPSGSEWSDVLRVPEDIEFGEYQIAVTGVPKDGSGAITIYAPLTIKERPEIKVEYDHSLFDESQRMTVTSETPLEIVRVTDQEGTLIEFDSKETGTTFTGYVTLRDPSSGTLTLEAYDRYGLEHSQKIYVSDPAEIRGGSVWDCGYLSWNLEGKDKRWEYKLSQIPTIRNEYVDVLLEYPTALTQQPEGKTHGLGISPNGEWTFYGNEKNITFASGSFETGLRYEPDSLYKENEELIKKINISDFFMLNNRTGEQFNLGSRYRKYVVLDQSDIDRPSHTFVMRESGSWFYVLKWSDNNEVYLLEQTKEDKLFKSNQCEFYPSMDYLKFESPHATAKIIKLSLDDMSIEETDYIPKRAWVSFADQTTGVVGYTSPEDELPHNSDATMELPGFRFDPRRTTWISNLEGTKIYRVADLDIPRYEGKDIRDIRVVAAGYLNDKLYTLLSVEYFNIYPDYEGEEPPPYVYADEIYALEMGTGKLIKIVDFDKRYSIEGFHLRSNIDNKIYLVVGGGIEPGEFSSNYVAYIGEDFKLNILHEISYEAFLLYFKKGAWNND